MPRLVVAVLASLLLHALLVPFGVHSASLATSSAALAPEDEVVVRSEPIRIEHRAPHPHRVERAISLRRGEGTYAPVASWVVAGTRTYRVSYVYVDANGNRESGIVPWPVRFPPGSDPFAHTEGGRRPMPLLPAPPPDFMPPGTLGKALRAYFPHLRFED